MPIEIQTQALQIHLRDFRIQRHKFLNFVDWKRSNLTRNQCFLCDERGCVVHGYIIGDDISGFINKAIRDFLAVFAVIKAAHNAAEQKINISRCFSFDNKLYILVKMLESYAVCQSTQHACICELISLLEQFFEIFHVCIPHRIYDPRTPARVYMLSILASGKNFIHLYSFFDIFCQRNRPHDTVILLCQLPML